MQFIHPEILYFLFLLIVPVLVHLFQLRRFKIEYFTNVRFLKALSIQTRKSSKIKKWLLLITRMVLMALIIIAFAQPYFDAKDSKNANNEMYIILDNSFSMQAKGEKGDLLKRAVQELLENTPENTTFSLLTNSDSYWNTNIKAIRTDLQNIKYSPVPFQLDYALTKVKSHKSALKKNIIIITDGVGLDKKQLKNIEVTEIPYFIIPKAEQKNNVAIDSVFIQKTLDNFYEIGVALSVYGDEIKPITVALHNKGKLIAKTVINFETKNKNILFTIPKQAFQGYVSIFDGGLEYDNSLFFSISKSKKINVISIGESEKSNFLARIYTDDEFNFANVPLISLDYNTLEKQNVIVLNELVAIPQALQTTLKSFVEKGGNLVVIPALTTSMPNINRFLSNFGSIQMESIANREKLITKINFEHPLFNTVFEKKINNFQYPKTKNSFILSSSSSAVLYYEDQSIFLTSIKKPISAVYVFAAPINTVNSNFQQSPLIVPTLYKMAQNIQKSGVNTMVIGNENSYIVEANLSKDEILTVKMQPENLENKFIPMQQILNNKVVLKFNDNPKEAGNFGIYKQNQCLENISFNYSRTESNLYQVNEAVLSQYTTSDSLTTVFNTLQTNRTDNQIWKWFVIFALLFLITEMVIIKYVK